MTPLFSLPNELIISAISSKFPCRELQIRSLATLLSIRGAPTRNIVLHGLEATGKSAITRALLQELSSPPTNGHVNGHVEILDDNLRYAIVKSAECIGGRHLLEQTVGAVAKAVNWTGNISRCENLSQLVVETGRLLEDWTTSEEEHERKKRFVLVFDGIDRQRDAPPTLLPALARLGEIIPHLTTIFITTSPRPNFLHTPGVPHISFPAYSKPELLSILTLTTPSPLLPKGAQETQDTWSRFCSAVWDSIAKHSSRSLLSFRDLCLTLWPKFIAPILSNQLSAQPFSKLLLANRALFQNDGVVVHNIVSSTTSTSTSKGIGTELPYYSRLLLVASYLASFNRPQTDSLFFMKTSSSKRRKRGGRTALTKTSSKPGVTKHRKIARKLLGPQAFILERMLAIFHAIKADATGGKGRGKVEGSADIYSAIATLASLRLLVKLGPGNANDSLEGGARYRVAVGWEVVRGVARSVGVEVEDYLAE